jgi:hypothetical protein
MPRAEMVRKNTRRVRNKSIRAVLSRERSQAVVPEPEPNFVGFAAQFAKPAAPCIKRAQRAVAPA